MTLARPMFPPRPDVTSAPGAGSACPADMILTSHADESQRCAHVGEPHAVLAACSAGASTLTRSFFMYSIVALPIVAAMPVATPANSAPLSPDVEYDHKAALARVEQIIDLLRTRYIREGWKIDEEGAARTLAYFRRCAEEGRFGITTRTSRPR
jgi:hypothetical protein